MAKSRNAAFAEEKAEVEVLLAQAQRHNELGKRISALKSRLQGGGRSVQDSIGPIHDNTREHQTISDNIDKLLKITDKMLEAGQDKSKEERIIRSQPSKTGINEYIASMKRLQRSHDQMQASNLKVQQQTIGDVNELLNEGSLKLQDQFRMRISERLQPVEPLHFITKQLPFPTLSEDRATQLGQMERAISATASDPRESPAVRMYSDLRASYLSSSLQGMALASITTSKRKNPEEPYRKGTSAVSTYANAMAGLFVAEFRNISTIFPRANWGLVFELTCRKSMADFAKTLRELNVYIKSNITTDCFLAFEIMEIVLTTSQSISSEIGETKLPFVEASKPMRETAKSAITDLLEDQRRRLGNLTTLSPDASVSPFTIETMTRLQNLAAYSRALSSILTSVGDRNWLSSSSSTSSTKPPMDVGADGNTLQSHYILDTIRLHKETLEYRARAIHKSRATLGVFLFNTVAVIDRMTRSSDLATLLNESNAEYTKEITTYRKAAETIYLDSWKATCLTLHDAQHTNRASGNRPASGASIPSAEIVKALSGKDKDATKERFRNFTTMFDEGIRRHREMMSGMEREVKSTLGRELERLVSPMYSRFYDRYEAVDRGRGKYVKYDKGGLAAMLAGLE